MPFVLKSRITPFVLQSRFTDNNNKKDATTTKLAQPRGHGSPQNQVPHEN